MHFRYFLAMLFGLLSFALGCKEFSFQSRQTANFLFSGVGGISKNDSGKYLVTWNVARGSNVPNAEEVIYGIYLKTSQAPDEGRPPQIIQLGDQSAPSASGELLAEVRGSTQLLLEQDLTSTSVYDFQVRVLNGSVKDNNSSVLRFQPGVASLDFGGVKNLKPSAAGTLMVNWDSVPVGNASSNLSYVVYAQTSEAPLEQILSGALAIETGLTLTQTQFGKLYEFTPQSSFLPSLTGETLARVEADKSSYDLGDQFTSEGTYLYQVRAFDGTEDSEKNRKVLVFKPDPLAFDGLMAGDAVLATDLSKITLSWRPAQGGIVTPRYTVYSDPGFSTVFTDTQETRLEIANPIYGRTYVFGVRATIGSWTDTNMSWISLYVPDPTDYTPPVFSGLKLALGISESKVHLEWDASPSNDLAAYDIYDETNLSSPLGSTTANFFVVSGLQVGSTHSYRVRARDRSGNRENNSVGMVATTFTASRPNFAGLSSATLQGTRGVLLQWTPASLTPSVSGYYIYAATDLANLYSSAPLQRLTDPAAASAVLTNLQASQNYYFLVRAYSSISGADVLEENRVVYRVTTGL